MSSHELEYLREKVIAEQATGCRGAGDYRRWAESQGYQHLAVIDWGSSAGDWSFLVSEDGQEWFIMWQTNNYPQGPGFTREVDRRMVFYGDEEEALLEAWDYLNG